MHASFVKEYVGEKGYVMWREKGKSLLVQHLPFFCLGETE